MNPLAMQVLVVASKVQQGRFGLLEGPVPALPLIDVHAAAAREAAAPVQDANTKAPAPVPSGRADGA